MHPDSNSQIFHFHVQTRRTDSVTFMSQRKLSFSFSNNALVFFVLNNQENNDNPSLENRKN